MQRTNLMWDGVKKKIVEFLERTTITDKVLEESLNTILVRVGSNLIREEDISKHIKPTVDVLNSPSYYMNMYKNKPVSEEELTQVKFIGEELGRLLMTAEKDERDRARAKSKEEEQKEVIARFPNLDEAKIKEKYDY